MALFLAFLLSFGVRAAHAETYYVEAGNFATRDAAATQASSARKAGADVRVVKRFQLNSGFEFVLVLDGLTSADAAETAAATIERATGQHAVVYSTGAAPVVDAAPEQAKTAAQWVTRASEAVGGVTGGADALARAPVVHFVFERTLRMGDKEVTLQQDYWRDGTNRRLDIKTFGNGTDSVAVTTAGSAWIKTGSTVTPRDIGVLVGTIDAFSPEAMLTIALGAADLLRTPEVDRFTLLEGGDAGIRLGTGGDESNVGLAWIDVDPATGLLEGARFVTSGGPIEWDLRAWKQVAPGVMIPTDVRVRRADGRHEVLKVKTLDVVQKAPEGLFAAPA